MKEIFVNHSINYLVKNNVCPDEKKNIFRYTLESLYSLITKTSTVLLLSFVIGTFKITFISILLYSLLRGFTFGIHATKNLYCWITTLSVYILFPYIIKLFDFPNIVLMGLNVIGLIAILLWAPADTPARPLLNKRKRTANKIISFLLAFSYCLLNIFLQHVLFSKIVTFILTLNAVCICPVTYAVFHIPYNNYKYYYK